MSHNLYLRRKSIPLFTSSTVNNNLSPTFFRDNLNSRWLCIYIYILFFLNLTMCAYYNIQPNSNCIYSVYLIPPEFRDILMSYALMPYTPSYMHICCMPTGFKIYIRRSFPFRFSKSTSQNLRPKYF